jgi:iron complex outermembrane receptor protein
MGGISVSRKGGARLNSFARGGILVCAVLLLAFPPFLFAETVEEEVLALEEIEVVGTIYAKQTGDVITQEDMQRDGAKDLWEAVRYVPGVILSGGGARNDSNFTVRGFGVDSIPIIVDGIVVANPYRGTGDAARLLTEDMESIVIHKGYSSTLLGANTMGGAVVIRTIKPKKPLEASYKSYLEFDGIYKYAANAQTVKLGTRRELFYLNGVFQYRDIDHFRLPESFEPTGTNPQKKGERLWSNSIDRKYTILAGVTPISGLDVWFTYVSENADKGFSPPETHEQKDYYIWQWPIWERTSRSLNAAYGGSKLSLNALVYYDEYYNRMFEYYNWISYEYGIHQPASDYDEYTKGVRLSAGWNINSENKIEGSLIFRQEDHKGVTGGVTGVHVNEETFSFGIEYQTALSDVLSFSAGLGCDMLFPKEFWGSNNDFVKWVGNNNFVVKTEEMRLYTWQAGIFYDISDKHEAHFTYARKNHFPTMSQRYSTRFGQSLPNPDLGAEMANHFELGYKGRLGNGIRLTASLYYNAALDTIVTVSVPNPDNPSAAVDFARNLDSTAFYGFEFTSNYYPNKMIDFGAVLSINKYSIGHTQSGVKSLSYFPEITANAYMEIMPVDAFKIIPRAEYVGSRYTDTTGSGELSGYLLLNIKAVWAAGEHFTVSAGAENILDAYYEIREHFPMSGRSFYLSVEAKY